MSCHCLAWNMLYYSRKQQRPLILATAETSLPAEGRMRSTDSVSTFTITRVAMPFYNFIEPMQTQTNKHNDVPTSSGNYLSCMCNRRRCASVYLWPPPTAPYIPPPSHSFHTHLSSSQLKGSIVSFSLSVFHQLYL